ncbi:hypothetical protein LJC61_01945 [Ruminococcaceae bacterium OttesenSCG-928-A16]|nr:hypothetical protein [Ruminococcaceae bacterium OttesenSCG-928-A16]
MNCAKCGAENGPEQAYCARCGETINPLASMPAAPPVPDVTGPPTPQAAPVVPNRHMAAQDVPFGVEAGPLAYGTMPVYNPLAGPVVPPSAPLYGHTMAPQHYSAPWPQVPQYPQPGYMPAGTQPGWGYAPPAALPVWQPKKITKEKQSDVPEVAEGSSLLLTAGQCFATILLGILPVAGLVLCLAWLYGKTGPPQKKNMAKAMLWLHGIALVALLVWLVIWVAGSWAVLSSAAW